MVSDLAVISCNIEDSVSVQIHKIKEQLEKGGLFMSTKKIHIERIPQIPPRARPKSISRINYKKMYTKRFCTHEHVSRGICLYCGEEVDG